MKQLPKINNALFISMGGIGNLVLLTPAINVFCRLYPEAKLHFILPDNGSRQLVECHPQIGRIIETGSSIRSLPSLISRIQKIHPDLVVASHGTNPFRSGMIGLLCRARIRLGENFGAGKYLYNVTVPFDQSLHECTANMNIISAITLQNNTTPSLSVWTTIADCKAAEQFISVNDLQCRWIGLHLGSGPAMSYKRWPTARFIDVAKQIVAMFNCRVVIFGGPDEAKMAHDAALQIGNTALSAAGVLTIRECIEVMKRASLFISNDSGPMHLAAAADIPVIAIFGPTMNHKTAPLGNKSIVLTAPIACRPCYSYKPVQCSTFECLNSITVKQVFDEAVKVLTR